MSTIYTPWVVSAGNKPSFLYWWKRAVFWLPKPKVECPWSSTVQGGSRIVPQIGEVHRLVGLCWYCCAGPPHCTCHPAALPWQWECEDRCSEILAALWLCPPCYLLKNISPQESCFLTLYSVAYIIWMLFHSAKSLGSPTEHPVSQQCELLVPLSSGRRAAGTFADRWFTVTSLPSVP